MTCFFWHLPASLVLAHQVRLWVHWRGAWEDSNIVCFYSRQAMARAFRGWLLACFGVLAIATVTGLEPGSAVSFSLDSKEVPDCSLQGVCRFVKWRTITSRVGS